MDMLQAIRHHLDVIDTQIAALLRERIKVCKDIGNVKKASLLSIQDPAREKQVIDHVQEIAGHPLFQECMEEIYHAIFGASKKVQHFLSSETLSFRRIGIVGLGLMGGSLCKGLKTKDPSIQISSLIYPSEDYAYAVEQGWIDQEYHTIQELAAASELLILATPISTICGLARQVASCQTSLIVLDLASVKQAITETFEALTNEKVDYVSSHPMAGREIQGCHASQALLFADQPWIMSAHAKNRVESLEKIEELIRFLGAHPVSLQAKDHDRKAALVSHVPGILSEAFFCFVRTVDKEACKIAGPSFASFTRMARDNPELRKEIVENNREIIWEFLTQWKESLI